MQFCFPFIVRHNKLSKTQENPKKQHTNSKPNEPPKESFSRFHIQKSSPIYPCPGTSGYGSNLPRFSISTTPFPSTRTLSQFERYGVLLGHECPTRANARLGVSYRGRINAGNLGLNCGTFLSRMMPPLLTKSSGWVTRRFTVGSLPSSISFHWNFSTSPN